MKLAKEYQFPKEESIICDVLSLQGWDMGFFKTSGSSVFF
jgi:hypothetical protein